QAGAGANQRLSALLPQPHAGVGGAPVLPDDGIVNGFAGRAVPHHHRLALVGDAEGRNSLLTDAGPRDGLACGGDHVAPDILGIVLDPAMLRVMLWKF